MDLTSMRHYNQSWNLQQSIIINLALTYEWDIQQININNVFLNGNLQEEVYMVQLPSFVNQNKDILCKLNKSLYGLKHAPRDWCEKWAQTFILFGFSHSRCDHSLFAYCKQGITIYELVYIDEILITRSSSDFVHKLINNIHEIFSLKRLGKLKYFQGIKIINQVNGLLFLTQSKYITILLARQRGMMPMMFILPC